MYFYTHTDRLQITCLKMDTVALLREIERTGGACSESLDTVEALYELWQPIRSETIALLNSVADELDDDNRKADKACVGLKAVSIGAGGAVLAGLALAPATGGASLAAVCGVVGVTSGAANAGKDLAFDEEKRRLLEETKRKLTEDKCTTERLQACIKELDANANEIKKIRIKISERQGIQKKVQQETIDRNDESKEMVQREFEALREGAAAIADFINHCITKGELAEITPTFAGKLKTALKAILNLPKTYCVLRQISIKQAQALSGLVSSSFVLGGVIAGTLAKGATGTDAGFKKVVAGRIGYAFTTIAMAIDAFELMSAAVRLNEGSITEEATYLRRISKELQQEKEDFDKIYSVLHAAAD